MQRLIWFIYSYFQSFNVLLKTFIIFFFNSNKKVLVKKLTKIKNILLIISAQERLGVVSKQKEIYQYRHWYRPKWVEKYRHIGYRQKSNIVHPYFISRNSDFITRNCEFISHNFVKNSQNCEIKSRNNLFFIFISGRKRASIVMVIVVVCYLLFTYI